MEYLFPIVYVKSPVYFNFWNDFACIVGALRGTLENKCYNNNLILCKLVNSTDLTVDSSGCKLKDRISHAVDSINLQATMGGVGQY